MLPETGQIPPFGHIQTVMTGGVPQPTGQRIMPQGIYGRGRIRAVSDRKTRTVVKIHTAVTA